MNAKELREAVARFEDWVQNSDVAALRFEDIERLADGAAIALPILEADPELVERIANCLRNYVVQVDTDRAWILFARAVLAAISTPTPVEES